MSTRRILGVCAVTLALVSGCSNEASVVGGDAAGDVSSADLATDLGPIDTGAMDAGPADAGAMDVPAADTGVDVPVDAPFRCATNADCTGQPGGPACDVTSGRCVPCTAASDLCPCLLYTSPSPRDRTRSRMPSSA